MLIPAPNGGRLTGMGWPFRPRIWGTCGFGDLFQSLNRDDGHSNPDDLADSGRRVLIPVIVMHHIAVTVWRRADDERRVSIPQSR